jgi:tRNA(Ile)-lysidine synthetase-like protein
MHLPGLRVIRSFDWILVEERQGKAPRTSPFPEAIPIRGLGKYRAPDRKSLIQIEIKECNRDGTASPIQVPGACATLKLDVLGSNARELELRGWRPGYHYLPQGHARDRKLKEMFQQIRLPSWRRPFWPILTLGPQIVWARGWGAAAEFAATAGERAVRVIEEVADGDAADGAAAK